MSIDKNSASPKELEGQVTWDEDGGTATLAIPRLRELLDNYEARGRLVEDYRALYGDLPTGARRDYKDQLFRFVFSRPEWALELYNALRGTDHGDPSDIAFTTIGSYLYLGMRNDVSFIIGNEMMMWEHQSTYNSNMPVRLLPTSAPSSASSWAAPNATTTGRSSSRSPCPWSTASTMGRRTSRRCRSSG